MPFKTIQFKRLRSFIVQITFYFIFFRILPTNICIEKYKLWLETSTQSVGINKCLQSKTDHRYFNRKPIFLLHWTIWVFTWTQFCSSPSISCNALGSEPESAACMWALLERQFTVWSDSIRIATMCECAQSIKQVINFQPTVPKAHNYSTVGLSFVFAKRISHSKKCSV